MTSSTHPFEQQEVMAYLDGELSANLAVSVAAHLRECQECAALARQMRDVSVRLSDWSVEPAPASLSKNLEAARAEHPMAEVRNPQGFVGRLRGKFPFLRNRWVWGAASAVALVILLLGGRLQTVRREPRHSEGLELAYTEQSRSADIPESNAVVAPDRAMAKLAPTAPAGSARGASPGFSSAAAYQQLTPEPTAPMIARTASVSLTVKDFAPLEASVKAIALHHNGYIASLNSASPLDAAHTLTATLRIPSAQLEAAIAELKLLGRVEQESQSGEEVTKEFTDREARMKNARATEERLLDVLRNHTGQVRDILATEQEIARVRGDIEQMEADQRSLQTRVDFATIELSVQEEYKASLQGTPTATGTRLHNAAIEGYRSVVESVIVFGVWALQSLPTVLLWGFVLFAPARWLWKRLRRTAVSQS
jgi:anti-sigma factor RsiW